MKSNERFRLFLNEWKDNNWRDNQSNLAKFLGLKRANLSNILSGKVGTSEESRKKICSKIDIDYWSIIKTDETNINNLANQNMNVINFPDVTKKANLQFQEMHHNLDAILGSGDKELISAIDTNLKSFKEIAILKQTVRLHETTIEQQKGKLDLMEGRLNALEKNTG